MLPIALLLAASPPQEDRAEVPRAGRLVTGLAAFERRPLPDGIFAEVDGTAIPESEYAGWLLRSLGSRYFTEFLVGRLVRAEAARADVSIGPEELDRLVEEAAAEHARSFYRGDPRRWEREELEIYGRSIEDWKRESRVQIETDRLAEGILRKRRRVGEEDVRRAWEAKHGPQGRSFVLRHILFRVRDPSPAESPSEKKEEFRKVAREETRQRAEAVRRQIAAGLEFGEAALRFSDDGATKKSGGKVERYVAGTYGRGFDEELGRVARGEVSPPLPSEVGWHLVEILDEKVVPFEEAAPALHGELEKARPPMVEVRAFQNDLLKKARIVRH
ncbi:MAG: peptidylprolyl isomerase [Planctomycetes bacterium]|nr:peptidylprolyl isomerase [Planctomycetota bacterium]